MWVRGAAIRPVPRFAVVSATTLDEIETELAEDSPRARSALDDAFSRFESTQPHLADTVSDLLSNRLDETSLALGYFLSIAVWLAFERTFGSARLREVSSDAIKATEAAVELEEELHAAHRGGPFDVDDVVSTEQPYVLAFVHQHVDAALGPASDEPASDEERRASVGALGAEDVHAVYRAIVLLTLCLSHAVVPVDGASRGGVELIA